MEILPTGLGNKLTVAEKELLERLEDKDSLDELKQAFKEELEKEQALKKVIKLIQD